MNVTSLPDRYRERMKFHQRERNNKYALSHKRHKRELWTILNEFSTITGA